MRQRRDIAEEGKPKARLSRTMWGGEGEGDREAGAWGEGAEGEGGGEPGRGRE